MECRFISTCERADGQNEQCLSNLGEKGTDGKSKICYEAMKWWESANPLLRRSIGEQASFYRITRENRGVRDSNVIVEQHNF